MGLLSSLNIASSALGVHQAGINIVSNNIANMNTEGYSKQRLHLGTNVLALPIGDNVYNQVKSSCGVEAIRVDRYTTSFLGSYYRDQLSEQAYLNKQAGALGDLANLFDDLNGKGLDGALQGFYDALDNLNQYPNDMAARVNLLNCAQELTGSMNKISQNLSKLNSQGVGDGVSDEALKNSEIYADVQKLNGTLEELAAVNKMLIQSHTGTLENNNLLDRRDTILNSLAELGGFDIEILENGVANVSIGNTSLVVAGSVKGTIGVQTAAKYDEYCQEVGIDNMNTSNAVLTITKDDGSVIQNANNKFKTGTIGAIIESASEGGSEGLRTLNESLDKLAVAVADVFNSLQTREGAFYLDTSPDGKVILSNEDLDMYALFTPNDGSATITASNIGVNAALLADDGYKKIAAAYFEGYDPADPTTFDINAVGNANNIIAMINTQTDNTADTFDIIGNISLNDYYAGILGKAASLAQSGSDLADIQNSVMESLENRKTQETSVDLNEELTDMIKFQTAYSASARVFSTCNTLLDTLINLGL